MAAPQPPGCSPSGLDELSQVHLPALLSSLASALPPVHIEAVAGIVGHAELLTAGRLVVGVGGCNQQVDWVEIDGWWLKVTTRVVSMGHLCSIQQLSHPSPLMPPQRCPALRMEESLQEYFSISV